MSHKTPSLFLYVNDCLAGTLSALPSGEAGGYVLSFSYTAQWEAQGFCLAPALPFGCVSTGASVWNFFSNLLPEGNVLEDVAARYNLRQKDVFGLLSCLGNDCAGAISLLPTANHIPQETSYQPISSSHLRDWMTPPQGATRSLFSFTGKPHMSLAGAQDKLGVYYDPAAQQLYLPLGATPSTHIIKPECTHEFTNCVINEHFIMSLAHKMGLNVPRSRILRLDGRPFYLVDRFDRECVNGRWLRIHQIDGCQFFDRPHTEKYESGEYHYAPKGLTLGDCFTLARKMSEPLPAMQQILRWCIFNYLTGNTDAHAKNISVIIHKGTMQLAPFYDLLCVRVYGNAYSHMAFSIGGEDNLHWIDTKAWDDMALECNIRPTYVRQIRTQMSQALLPTAKALVKTLEFTNVPREEKKMLLKILGIIARQTG